MSKPTKITLMLDAIPVHDLGAGGHEANFQALEIAKELQSVTGISYLGNAFSLQMVDENAIICKTPIEASEIPDDAVCVIGHADTAKVVSAILGHECPMNRTSVHLNSGDCLYVAQVIGGRLPEGATELPDGAELKFYKVTVKS